MSIYLETDISSCVVIKVHLIGAFVHPRGGGKEEVQGKLSVICYVAYTLGPAGWVALHGLVIEEDS